MPSRCLSHRATLIVAMTFVGWALVGCAADGDAGGTPQDPGTGTEPESPSDPTDSDPDADTGSGPDSATGSGTAPVPDPDDRPPSGTAADRDPPREPVTPPDLQVELQLTDVASMEAPMAGAVGPDGVLYLAERAGTVHPLTDDGVGAAIIDIRGETTTDGERGLLGLTFADDGSELYLSYTDNDGATVLEAVTLPGDGTVAVGERRTLFTLDQPYSNHNGGNVVIGPDGMLYLGLGDGGGAGDPLGAGQDLRTALGALLRFDPSSTDPAAVPDDNPFVGRDDAAAQIYAYGLRNPWRFSFDPVTDHIYLADVGQHTVEEINVVAFDDLAGANFGWNAMEGTRVFGGAEPDDHVPPVHEYEHGEQSCSVTGGYVYRGEAIPGLVGAYLYTDLCAPTVSAIVVEDGEVVDEGTLGIGGEQVVSFAQDADGELYLLHYSGAVRRIDPA